MFSFAQPARWAAAPLILLLALSAAAEEARQPLPEPTGDHAVGTMVWHWIDPDRADEVTEAPDDRQQIMAQLWYPAAALVDAPRAPYAALYPTLVEVGTWSVAGALVAGEGPLPVIVFCPGRGMARHFYTGLAEDLASHGYAVLAIDSPHTGRVVYPDGREISPDGRYRPSRDLMMGPYEKVDEFFEVPATAGAGDVAFAVRQLQALHRRDPANRLTGRLSFDSMGIFGHSLGGRIAGAAAAADRRFRAYAAMEGVAPRAVRKGGMDAAVAMWFTSGLPDIAQPNLRDVIPNRRNDVFMVTLVGFSHNSVTDLPILDPENYRAGVDPEVALDRSRLLLRTFFDQYVKGVGGPTAPAALAALGSLEEVEIEVHAQPTEQTNERR